MDCMNIIIKFPQLNDWPYSSLAWKKAGYGVYRWIIIQGILCTITS